MRGRLSKCAAVFIAVVLAGLGVQPAAADDGKDGPDRHQHEYLALGDSVPFGFSPLVRPPVESKFIGYPEYAAPQLKLALTNASCPGQTSQSFISGGPDNGCFGYRFGSLGPPPTPPFPLHTAYSGTQLDFALSYLHAHPRTKLVTLTLGANDLLLCPNACASLDDLKNVLLEYQLNLTTILTAIRAVYYGELVAVTYYSTDYTDLSITGPVAALNAVTAGVTYAFGGETADGFTAFAAAAAYFGGKPCEAGLLIPLPEGGCDKHPTEKGAKLLAQTLARVVRHSGSDDGDREDSLVGAAG